MHKSSFVLSVFGVLLSLTVLLASSAPARANGAFPDSLQVLLPANQPNRIILTTNFGLIISDDDGATWEWVCEPRANDNVILYQQAATPSDRLFAVMSLHGLDYSDDDACTWNASAGALSTAIAHDAFADPTNQARVFAIASMSGDGFVPSSVFRSDDGGLTFGAALDTAPAGGDLLGVESAVSDPATVYLAMYGTQGATAGLLEPFLGRSSDGGLHWARTSLASSIGSAAFRIIAVDPTNPQRLFLRVTEAFAEKIAVSSNGGASFTEPLMVDQQFSAFVRLQNGTLLLAGSNDDKPIAYRSKDDGATFQAWPSPPHLRAMAERDGKLYAAADNFLDQFALAVSTDEGATFQPLLTFDKVKRIKPCVQELCRDVCNNMVGLTLWPQQVCGEAPDGGATDAGTGKPTPTSGCGCDASGAKTGRGAGGGAAAFVWPLLLLVPGAWLLASRPGRRTRATK